MQHDDRITVAIADEHALMRDGLRLILDAEEGIDVVAEAADTRSTFAVVGRHEPSILLLDVNLDEQSGLAALAELTTGHPATAVVVLTTQRDPAVARRALADGASGYVLKDAARRELVGAIRTVAAGGTYVQPQLAAALLTDRAARAEGPLTEREREVLGLIAVGHTNGEIAEQLYISVRTVESHRARIQEKLGLSSRAELMRYAHEHGIAQF